jgi:hypothetical protein
VSAAALLRSNRFWRAEALGRPVGRAVFRNFGLQNKIQIETLNRTFTQIYNICAIQLVNYYSYRNCCLLKREAADGSPLARLPFLAAHTARAQVVH